MTEAKEMIPSEPLIIVQIPLGHSNTILKKRWRSNGWD